MAAAGAVAVLGERAGPKKERMELAETSLYSDKLDMLLRRHLGTLRREAVGNHSSRCSSRSSGFEGSGDSHTPDLSSQKPLVEVEACGPRLRSWALGGGASDRPSTWITCCGWWGYALPFRAVQGLRVTSAPCRSKISSSSSREPELEPPIIQWPKRPKCRCRGSHGL